MEYNMVMAYADGASVRGTPGLFYPADKARVDYLWQKIHAMDNSELSFAGDVEGFTLQDTVSGAHTVFLTVDGLDQIKDDIAKLKDDLSACRANLDAVNDNSSGDIADILQRLDQIDANLDEMEGLAERVSDCEAGIDAVAEEQLSYFKGADFNTVDGSLIFFDGLGAHAFTLGGATWDTVAGE